MICDSTNPGVTRGKARRRDMKKNTERLSIDLEKSHYYQNVRVYIGSDDICMNGQLHLVQKIVLD